MQGALAVGAAIAWLLILLTDVALIIAAFRTGPIFGVLTIFVPFYAVTTGNHRLATPRRKQLAIAWWVFLGLAIVFAVGSGMAG
jgi:hypothetical protein